MQAGEKLDSFGGYRRFVSSILDIGILRKKSWLEQFLGGPISPDIGVISHPAAIHIGWGQKASGQRAWMRAMRRGQSFWLLEDGFLRSIGLGVNGDVGYSIVVDDLGIYYDATRPSRLEALICTIRMTPDLTEQANRALSLVRRYRLSKYNHAPAYSLPERQGRYKSRVLVIDQTFGDVSVRLGGGRPETFSAMFAAALNENPDAEIIVKTHPDVLTGKKSGYLKQELAGDRVKVLAEDICPLSLLEQVDKVYTVTSQMGFEALIAEKPVVCFGQPWYAGWGLTDDRHPDMDALRDRRGEQRSLEELFAAAYLQYARYINPLTGAAGGIFDVIAWLARNKTFNDATRGNLYCIGMSKWKRAIVRPFLRSPSARVHFVPSVSHLTRQALPADARIVMWGIKDEQVILPFAAEHSIPVWRMEDGFLRSVGLGSDLHRPASLVLDRGGMYYDPASGSDLERLIATQQLSEDDLERARSFRQRFTAMRASKYNLARAPVEFASHGRRVLLVPGQVEDDASIKRGSPVVSTNHALLESVRAANPDAFIVFKPHPDVVAGNRQGSIPAEALARLANQCVTDANIIDCILAADEVHTMTSLSGFEALLHGRVVHCYGGPFYAGWGLTVDHFPLPHRSRQASLDELVFATMLSYPRYALPGTHGYVPAEIILDTLVARSAQPSSVLSHQSGFSAWFSRMLRKSKALWGLFVSELTNR
jgi:capsular polysaccharide export protein